MSILRVSWFPKWSMYDLAREGEWTNSPDLQNAKNIAREIGNLEGGLYAPNGEGELVLKDAGSYNTGSNVGYMGKIESRERCNDFTCSGSALSTHVQAKVPQHKGSGKPISILVHGFDFDPRDQFVDDFCRSHNPHKRLYHWNNIELDTAIKEHCSSWPLGLGYAKDDEETGLCVGFGWLSRLGGGEYTRAYEYLAPTAANYLVAMIEVLSKKFPGEKINLMCHSLGSRVVVRAIKELAKSRQEIIKNIHKVIILAGAVKVKEVKDMMKCLCGLDSKQNTIPEFYNFIVREDGVLDTYGENQFIGLIPSGEVIGHNGIGEGKSKNWIDIQLDDEDTKLYFREKSDFKIDIKGDVNEKGDHWIHYTWPPNMELYRQIIRHDDVELIELRKAAFNIFKRPHFMPSISGTD